MTVLRVVVEDDRRFVASALARALDARTGVEVVGVVTAGTDRWAATADADVLVTGPHVPRSRAGTALVMRYQDHERLADVVDAVAVAGGPVATTAPTAPPLSPRELAVAQLLASGLTAGEIGERLGISRETVASHKRHLYSKLGVGTQAQAIAKLVRCGLLDEVVR